MKLRFARQAVRELADIADYVRLENPAAARAIRERILAATNRLRSFPSIGRRQSIEGVRKLPVSRTSILIYYRFDEAAGEVVIISIQHAARSRIYSDR